MQSSTMKKQRSFKVSATFIFLVIANTLFGQPVLELSKTSQHIGAFPQDQLIRKTLTFQNTGDELLYIVGASNYIGNVGFNFHALKLAPNETGTLEVITGTGKTIGELGRKVDLLTNVGKLSFYFRFTVYQDSATASNYRIDILNRKDSTFTLSLSGWFRTTGACQNATPAMGLEKFENNTWRANIELVQMDCGLATIVLDEHPVVLHTKNFHWMFGQPIRSGTYRFVAWNNSHKPVYSKPFELIWDE
jgi:hypothetical protein